MNLTWDSLRAANATLERWRSQVNSWGSGAELKYDQELHANLMNDLDTPKVLIRLRAIEKDMTLGALDKRAIFLYADQVLGLELSRAPKVLEISDEVKTLIDLRATARAEGNWSESDRLRDQLFSLGYKVQDGKS
jgi:cysteinyl-tRNA synthetase